MDDEQTIPAHRQRQYRRMDKDNTGAQTKNRKRGTIPEQPAGNPARLVANSADPDQMHVLLRPTRARCYKTFFMLSSAEHEIFSANKYENANYSCHFHIY